MLSLPWIILDALQAGALLALAASYGADALHRRDSLVGWLALSCALVAVRHGVCVLGASESLNPELVSRVEALFSMAGFITMTYALLQLFRPQAPRPFMALLLLGMAPNVVRCLALPAAAPAAHWCEEVANVTYILSCLGMVLVVGQARRAGQAMAEKIFGGLAVATLPIVIEAILRGVFRIHARFSGLSLMLLAITTGVSWMWIISQDLAQKASGFEAEAKGWRSLVPGITWRTGEPNLLMESLFGHEWDRHLAVLASASDQTPYELHRVSLGANDGELGWLESREEAHRETPAFLDGWRVALGMDPGEDFLRVRGWLEAWGAEVQPWGTVPPRNGPFPSIIIWAREPSILAVWREDDLARRRCRWVQVGGAQIEGPHARLGKPAAESDLLRCLQGLLSFAP